MITPAPRQWKASALDGAMMLFVEPAQGIGPRYFVATTGNMTIRIPISAEVTDERVLHIMMARLEQRLFAILEKFTAPPKH